MGHVVTFPELRMNSAADGIGYAPITENNAREMAAQFVRIAPGKNLSERVPRNCDAYLFVLSGHATIAAGGDSHPMSPHSFAAIGEGTDVTLANDGSAPVELIKVTAPVAPNEHEGLRGTLHVAARATAPTRDVPK